MGIDNGCTDFKGDRNATYITITALPRSEMQRLCVRGEVNFLEDLCRYGSGEREDPFL